MAALKKEFYCYLYNYVVKTAEIVKIRCFCYI